MHFYHRQKNLPNYLLCIFLLSFLTYSNSFFFTMRFLMTNHFHLSRNSPKQVDSTAQRGESRERLNRYGNGITVIDLLLMVGNISSQWILMSFIISNTTILKHTVAAVQRFPVSMMGPWQVIGRSLTRPWQVLDWFWLILWRSLTGTWLVPARSLTGPSLVTNRSMGVK